MVTNPNFSFSGDPTGAGAAFAGLVEAGELGVVVNRLNSLLRGEISAAETYRNVLVKAASDPDDGKVTGLLQGIQSEHVRVSQLLRERIIELGGEPADSSGAWGVWAQAVQGTMTLLGGEGGGLRALREGEEHGMNDYENSLNELDATTAQMVQNQLLPAQARHIEMLKVLIAGRQE